MNDQSIYTDRREEKHCQKSNTSPRNDTDCMKRNQSLCWHMVFVRECEMNCFVYEILQQNRGECTWCKEN